MAMSLLYALLDVDDQNQLASLEQDPAVQAALPSLPSSATPEAKLAHEKLANKKRAVKYHKLPLKQKKEIRKALYDALYHILEYSNINRDLSMAIGYALCNAINENRLGVLRNEAEKLRYVLKPIVTEAIDEL